MLYDAPWFPDRVDTATPAGHRSGQALFQRTRQIGFARTASSFACVVVLCGSLVQAAGAESAYCKAKCTGNCAPITARLGEKNFAMGSPLVFFNPVPLGVVYSWSWTGGPDGTPNNLTGISSDEGFEYFIPQVQMSDSGLYTEFGTAINPPPPPPPATAPPPQFGAIGWCLTVDSSPVAAVISQTLLLSR